MICAALLCVLCAVPLLGACGQAGIAARPIAQLELPTILYSEEDEPVQTPWSPGDEYPVVTITLADGGVITAELYPDKAPNTVHNFIAMVGSGYFEGRVFHRAKSGFMIQGGSPNGDGMSTGFPYSIKGEFANNGFSNDLKHLRGVLSMARMNGMNDSASSQFFIMHADYPYLDDDYATFGKVIDGMDVVDRVATSPTTGYPQDLLLAPVVIKSVTADTRGIDYPAPVVIPAR